jgi:hypothetical protein
MKVFYSFLSAAIFFTVFTPIKGHALVIELALCSTATGEYRISVLDNQGIGPVRVSHISASITNSGGVVVATYPAEIFRGIQSVSFGRPKYQDIASSGSAFLLEGPSTNAKNYILHAVVQGAQIADTNLNCAVFGGAILNH